MLVIWFRLLVVASVVCTWHTAWGQVQSFVVRPTDVSVIQGQTATMRCQVAHMKGRPQWTKDGFALGFSRDIPGFPRYRMDGSVSLGEHHLVIESAQMSDDAEFQCQVTPAGGDPPLVGTARLSVIVPPQQPEIVGYQNGSVVRVSDKLQSLDLTCRARSAKPAATLTWLRNGVELSADDAEVTYSTRESADRKLHDAESVLTFAPSDDDNEAYYTCAAQNEALQRPYTVTVQLGVLHPPGKPEITGYSSEQVLKTGDTARLVCVSRGGNPLAQVYWYRNGAELDFSYVSGGGRAENELIFTVQPSDNNAVYRCAASNQMTTQPLTTDIQLTVQFSPEKVTISGHRNAKAGDTIKLSCVSAISNPPAVISWFTRGRHLPGSISNVAPSAQGGFVTTSEVDVVVTERENDVIYQCHGTNEALGQTVVDTITLKVMYPPEMPTISGYIDGRSVYAGNVLSLTCTSVGGNPPATLTWLKGSTELDSVRRITGNIVSSQVSFLLKPDDNNAEYTCQASNDATTQPLVTTVNLRVSFPPKSLNISLSPPVVKAGQTLTITCTSSTSNPASRLSWWKDGDQVVDGVDDDGTTPAEYGGWSTISRLVMTPGVEDHGEIYACRATNTLLDEAVSDAVTLNVLYKPYFPSEVPVVAVTTENESLTLNMTARANPADITYSWYRGVEKLVLGSSRFRQDAGVLTVTSGLRRAEAGVYTCEASNAEGSTTHDINIDVHYAAEIVSVTTGLLVSDGDTAMLECHVRANPLGVDGLITWSRPGYDMSRAVVEAPSVDKSRLTIAGVERRDAGAFHCNAFNGVGDVASAVAELVVKFSPEVDKSPVYRKAAAESGSTATMTCKAAGAPDVDFTWFKEDEQLPIRDDDTDGSRFDVVSTRKLSVVQYESVLRVYNTTKGDYGSYKCLASNELGSDSLLIALDGTSKPDSPYNLQFINATHDSVTLSWQPGFDGGLPQRFQVRYGEVGGEGMKYEDVVPRTANTYTVKGLKLGTEYEMIVVAINARGENDVKMKAVKAMTSAVRPPSTTEESTEEIPLLVILIICIVGFVLLALNILLIAFFLRRRRKKFHKELTYGQAHTVELINTPVFVDDMKSYTTYDQRSIDDVDDYKPPYNPSHELSPFFSTTEPYYPASYFDHGQPSRSAGTDDGYPAWRGPHRGAPAGGVHSGLPPPPDQIDEDTYRKQLRKMQRSMSPGSLQQLQSMPPEPRESAGGRPATPPPPLPPVHSRDGPVSHASSGARPSDVPRYAPPNYDTSHSSLPAKRPASQLPPEMRGHLV